MFKIMSEAIWKTALREFSKRAAGKLGDKIAEEIFDKVKNKIKDDEEGESEK